MKKLLIVLFILISCKKKDCRMLLDKVNNTTKEYETASKNYTANETEENLQIANDKYEADNKARAEFTKRGCYYGNKY